MRYIRQWLATISTLLLLGGCQTVGNLAMQLPRELACAAGSAIGASFSSSSRRYTSSQPARRTSRYPVYHTPQTRPTGRQIRQMIEYYNCFEYEKCLAAADKIITNRLASNTQLATAYAYKGTILFMQQQTPAARRCYRKVFQHNPSYTIDRQRFKPAIVKFGRSCKN